MNHTPFDDPHVSAGEIADYLYSYPQPMDLLPCPFCAAVPAVEPGANGHGYTAACANADCPLWLVETRTYDTPEATVQIWNTRPFLAPIPEEVSCSELPPE